jgi:hypothetical protein
MQKQLKRMILLHAHNLYIQAEEILWVRGLPKALQRQRYTWYYWSIASDLGKYVLRMLVMDCIDTITIHNNISHAFLANEDVSNS